jgi:hypothetical protein
MPPKSRAVISARMLRKMAAFLPMRSSRVSPGFWLAPAVMTTRAQSVMSS